MIAYEFTAFNFAEESSNKIHSDAVARQYGFRGGLVPGIGVFAYMTHPVVAQWGPLWLERGSIQARFAKPVYSGDRVRVELLRSAGAPDACEIQVTNADGTLCAQGSADLSRTARKRPEPSDYPQKALPSTDRRMMARAAHLPPGTVLGSLAFSESAGDVEARVRNEYLSDLPLFSGLHAPYHPAYLLAQANHILMMNVDLGPWIHVSSDLVNFSSAKAGEKLEIRGRIARSYEKRGHELVDMDLAIFDAGENPVTVILHTAIVHLRRPSP